MYSLVTSAFTQHITALPGSNCILKIRKKAQDKKRQRGVLYYVWHIKNLCLNVSLDILNQALDILPSFSALCIVNLIKYLRLLPSLKQPNTSFHRKPFITDRVITLLGSLKRPIRQPVYFHIFLAINKLFRCIPVHHVL